MHRKHIILILYIFVVGCMEPRFSECSCRKEYVYGPKETLAETKNKNIKITKSINTLKSGIGLEFELINPGSFIKKYDWYPPGKTFVTLTDGFWMSKYEISQKQYEFVMNNNPSNIKCDNYPVDNVEFVDAVKFCNKLSVVHGLDPVYSIFLYTKYCPKNSETFNVFEINKNANGFRLPTNVEWEYACRAGTITAYPWGDEWRYEDDVDIYMWYRENSSGVIHEIGSLEPNPWGLYDMLGNVQEWCHDTEVHSFETITDPEVKIGKNSEILKGGMYSSKAYDCRIISSSLPSNDFKGAGFRIILPLSVKYSR